MTNTNPNPVYRIEVYDTTPTLRYSFGNTSTDKVEVLQWMYKQVITDGIGYFSFTVPTVSGPNYKYTDISLMDYVYFKHGYSTLPANNDFAGRVYDISAPLSTPQGYVRIISGLDLGEVLLRRQKTNTLYSITDADDIVLDVIADLAPDISLVFSAVDVETTDVPLEIRTMTYWDIMRAVSDFDNAAGTTIKKDFYVNVNKGIRWASRPWRHDGTEPTFTVGKDIIDYNVKRKVEPVRNNITVYGFANKKIPANDLWCESTDAWTLTAGLSIDTNNVIEQVGSVCIEFHTAVAGSVVEGKCSTGRQTIRNINKLFMWTKSGADSSLVRIKIFAPDDTHYFYHDTSVVNNWYFNNLSLGPDYEYDAATNPDGVWTPSGTANWWDMRYVDVRFEYLFNDRIGHVDGILFYPERWSYNTTAAYTYGRRDLEVTDDRLHSDAECQQRAETLLYQLKDPPVQIDITTPGDSNILVGDRVHVTIPAESISGDHYDITAVEHSFSHAGYFSKATMVNSANIREPVETSLVRSVANLKRQVRYIANYLQRIG